MPFHFCTDELLAILAMIPFIGLFFRRLHTWYHTKRHHKCHKEGCIGTHVEHQSAPLVFPEMEVWDPIYEEDVEERFGKELVLKLYKELQSQTESEFINDGDIDWYVNENSEVKAEFSGRIFLHDKFSQGDSWDEVVR